MTSGSKLPAGFDWRSELKVAMAMGNVTVAEAADRGRLFELILYAMLLDAGLDPRTAYRPDGEEIDGSFWCSERTILLEAKWTAKTHPVSEVYRLRGKVDGKLFGTLGLFVSMGGFSPHVPSSLVKGKEINILLMDGKDIQIIADGHVSIEDAIRIKLRAAGDSGSVYFPLEVPVALSQGSPQSMWKSIRVTDQVAPVPSLVKEIIIVEGPRDRSALEGVLRSFPERPELRIFTAGGISNMVPLMLATASRSQHPVALTLIFDGIDKAGAKDSLARAVKSGEILPDHHVIYPEPSLADVLSSIQIGVGPASHRALGAPEIIQKARDDHRLAEILAVLGLPSATTLPTVPADDSSLDRVGK